MRLHAEDVANSVVVRVWCIVPIETMDNGGNFPTTTHHFARYRFVPRAKWSSVQYFVPSKLLVRGFQIIPTAPL